MHKDDKERVVTELTQRLRDAETLIVADYRGLTMPQIDALRGRLIESGAKFTVVKNTLTRRAAEAAGVDALLAMLEGPSAIAFIDSDGDMVAVAKALADSARDTKVLAIRGGLLQGRTISGADVEELAKLPPFDVLRGQVLGAISAPLSNLLGLVNAPLQNLVGLIDARIDQLGGEGAAVSAAPEAAAPAAESPAEGAPEGESVAEAEAAPGVEAEEPAAEAEAGSDQAGSDQASSDQASSDQASSDQASSDEATADEPGPEEPAAEAEPAAESETETAEVEAEAEAPETESESEDQEA